MSNRLPRFWQYSPGGVLSEDGVYQVSGRDRFSYYFRKSGSVAILPCEHFERDGTPAVAFDLKDPIELAAHDGARPMTSAETDEVRRVLVVAMPLMGRAVIFD